MQIEGIRSMLRSNVHYALSRSRWSFHVGIRCS